MTLVVCFLSFHYIFVYLLNFYYILVYLLNYEFVDVWFLSQLYLKLGPGFNSILVSPLLGPTLDCVAVVGQTLYRELHE
jgi:hypothetical protein